MKRAEIIEALQEAIRRLRIERDAGNDSVHDQILKLTSLVGQVRKLKGDALESFAEQYGIE